MLAQPAQTASINSALRLGVLDALTEGQKTVDEISNQCELNRAGTAALLQVLVEIGLLEQFEEHFALSQAARLTPKALWAITFDQWTGLEQALSINRNSDEPEFEKQQRQEKRLQQFQAIHSQIQWAATGVALNAAEALGICEERQALKILDLGCGSAVYSMTLVHRDPQSHVTLVDTPYGLGRAEATVNSLDVQSRVAMLKKDDFLSQLPEEQFDLVIIADQIHQLSMDQLSSLLQTAFGVLSAGGELALIDIFPGQPRGKMNCHVFELQLLTGTGSNMHAVTSIRRAMESAGFQKIQYTDLPVAPYTHGLILGAKA